MVLYTPVSPHARDIVMRHVAMEEKISGQLLAETGSALRFQIHGLGRSDDFHVDAIRLRPDHGILDGTVLRRMPQRHFRRWLAGSAANESIHRADDESEHFEPPCTSRNLAGSPRVAARNGRGRIAERIGAVGHRLVLEAEVFVLRLHIVDAERLAPIVQARATGR